MCHKHWVSLTQLMSKKMQQPFHWWLLLSVCTKNPSCLTQNNCLTLIRIIKQHKQHHRLRPNRRFNGNNGPCLVHLAMNSLHPQQYTTESSYTVTKHGGGHVSTRAFVLLWFNLLLSVRCWRFMMLSVGCMVKEWWIITWQRWQEQGKDYSLTDAELSVQIPAVHFPYSN